MRNTVMVGLALAAVLGAGCQSPDVGQPCELQASLPPGDVAADFLESGNTNCESLICIKSPAASRAPLPDPYCSKACVSNDDCFQSETKLVCRPVTVDFTYLQSLSPTVQQQYLELLGCHLPASTDAAAINAALQACAQNSSYCATPIQSQ